MADLSFISLATVLAPLRAVAASDADFCFLVKPQFEAGPRYVERGGVVRDSAGWAVALDRVAAAAGDVGLTVRAGTVSGLPGPAGNIEFFLWLHGLRAPARVPRDAKLGAAAPAGAWRDLRERLLDEGRALRAMVHVASGRSDP